MGRTKIAIPEDIFESNPTIGGVGDWHNVSPFLGGVSSKEPLPGIYFKKPLLE